MTSLVEAVLLDVAGCDAAVADAACVGLAMAVGTGAEVAAVTPVGTAVGAGGACVGAGVAGELHAAASRLRHAAAATLANFIAVSISHPQVVVAETVRAFPWNHLRKLNDGADAAGRPTSAC